MSAKIIEEDHEEVREEVRTKPESLLSALSKKLGFEPLQKEPLKCKIHEGFLLPIEYLDLSQVHLVPPTVSADLEITASMMRHLCGGHDHFLATCIADECALKYTTNVDFLEQTQEVVLATCTAEWRDLDASGADRFREVWRDLKEDAAFLEKHAFMEWKALEELNQSRPFLQIYSMMNIISPIFSLAMPVLMLMFPFILLKIQGIAITFDQYVATLRDIAKSHFLGRALSIKNFSVESVLYLLFILGLYALQTYQNVVSCKRYYACIKRMNTNLCDLREYLRTAVHNMDRFVKTHSRRSYYTDFCQDVFSHKLVLEEIRDKIGDALTPFCLAPRKMADLGHMLECYYQLYVDVDYEESLRFSAGFAGYLAVIRGVGRNYVRGGLGKCTFVQEPALVVPQEEDDDAEEEEAEPEEAEPVACVFVQQYYPPHGQPVCGSAAAAAVRNDVSLSRNLILTGVNASGKTTALKTTAINILFSQQFGFGFYASATVRPFHHIHSYLNIPDTSGRDSLFQAESRRCKDILDKIGESSASDRHFCLFDELYSGTNPKEAAKSAISLLKYLAARPNVRFMLTTHYVKVCKRLKRESTIENWKMAVETQGGRIVKYTYRMTPGISTQEGGIEILQNMDYPEEILKDMR